MRASLLVFGCAALLALAVVPGSAAPARRSATPPRESVEPVGTWTSSAPPARDCSRVRRKFWQEDGWVVRAVVACR